MGRRGFLVLAGLFALSAVAALVFHVLNAPTQLRLAVGPIGSEDVRMAAAFVQAVNRDKGSLRLRLVISDGLEDSAAKLDRGSAELAIVRPDIALPVRGETLLITRRFFPFFATSRATASSASPRCADAGSASSRRRRAMSASCARCSPSTTSRSRT